ncbi:MAG: hypothetical protein J7J20_04880 [Desulfurococcales archaeon]|nr:hypothetical protein [Desulfurococcales archaeon]
MSRKYSRINRAGSNFYVNKINYLRILAGKERLLGRRARSHTVKLVLCSSAAFFLITHVILSLLNLRVVFTMNPHILEYSAIISAVAGFSWPYVYYYVKAHSRGNAVESELKYFIISEGVSTTNASELISDLVSTKDWSHVFPTLSKESIRFLKLRKFMALYDTIRYYTRWITSRWVSKCLTDYIHSLSLGTALEWLQDKTDELINELRSSTQAAIKLRTTVSLILAVILGYVPPLMAALSLLVGEEVVVKAFLMTLLATPLSMLLIPKLPCHARITSRILDANIPLALGVACATTAATVLITYVIKDNVNVVLTAATCLLVWGSIKTYCYFRGITEAFELPRLLARISEAPLVISNPCRLFAEILSSSRVRSFKYVGSRFKLDKVNELASELNLWTSKFVLYVIAKSIINGALTRERTLKLRELILDFTRDIKSLLATNTVIVVMTALLPYIISSISGLATHSLLLGVYSLVTSVMFSVYASYVVFGDLTNTLLPGMALLMLYLIGGSL